MTSKQGTTYPKAKLAEIKKRGAKQLAVDVMSEIKWQSGNYTGPDSFMSAETTIDTMTTRQVTQFLKDNGYSFNVARAIWQAAKDEATS